MLLLMPVYIGTNQLDLHVSILMSMTRPSGSPLEDVNRCFSQPHGGPLHSVHVLIHHKLAQPLFKQHP